MGGLACPVQLQPAAFDGLDVAVPHDPGRAATGVHPEQVLGVGAASLTLAAATPRANVHSALDLGTGCGIQALLADDHADAVLATGTRPLGALLAVLAASAGLSDGEVAGQVLPVVRRLVEQGFLVP